MKTLLFFDDWLFDRRTNLRRELGGVEFVAESRLAIPHKTKGGCYVTAIYDENLCVYRLWHSDFLLPETGRGGFVIRYAESKDGWHWESKAVGENDKSQAELAKDVVFSCDRILCEATVWYDPSDPDPDRRFKMPYIAVDTYDPPVKVQSRWAFSADGLNWRIEENSSWIDHISDTFNSFVRNPKNGLIHATVRKCWGDRRVASITGEDLLTWSEPRMVLQPDSLDPMCVHFYGMPQFYYEGYFIGLLWLMHTEPEELSFCKSAGSVDCQLAYSYDGLAWHRSIREPFISRRPGGTYGSGCLYPSSLIQDPQGGLRIYAGGTRSSHGKSGESAILSYKLRKDGFIKLATQGGPGRLITKMLKLNSPSLSLNASAPAGAIKVQISDTNGKALSGYSFHDSIAFTGDEVAWQPSWREHHNLCEAMGTEGGIRLEIEAYNAELYAIHMDCGLILMGGVVDDLS